MVVDMAVPLEVDMVVAPSVVAPLEVGLMVVPKMVDLTIDL